MDDTDDKNLKNASSAVEMVMLQQKAKEYQDKVQALGNKEYQGRNQGVAVTMKGNYDVVDVHIDQAFYETAGKDKLEKAFLTVLTNLHRMIDMDQDQLKQELQMAIVALQKEAGDGTH
jgi:DNA-binding protein YbaB